MQETVGLSLKMNMNVRTQSLKPSWKMMANGRANFKHKSGKPSSAPLQHCLQFGRDAKPLHYFSAFVPDLIFEMIVTETNPYACQMKLHHWKQTSAEELRALLGILIKMALLQHQSTVRTGQRTSELNQPSIAAVMTLSRYQKLLQAQHLNDNTKSVQRAYMHTTSFTRFA